MNNVNDEIMKQRLEVALDDRVNDLLCIFYGRKLIGLTVGNDMDRVVLRKRLKEIADFDDGRQDAIAIFVAKLDHKITAVKSIKNLECRTNLGLGNENNYVARLWLKTANHDLMLEGWLRRFGKSSLQKLRDVLNAREVNEDDGNSDAFSTIPNDSSIKVRDSLKAIKSGKIMDQARSDKIARLMLFIIAARPLIIDIEAHFGPLKDENQVKMSVEEFIEQARVRRCWKKFKPLVYESAEQYLKKLENERE